MTQVLTGHSRFGEYLCRIRRESTTACHHCKSARDTAQHTLEECPAWEVLRRDLKNEVRNDLSLPVLIVRMVDSERFWKAVASFCEQVMLQKEAAERIRRQEAAAAAVAGSDTSEEDVSEEYIRLSCPILSLQMRLRPQGPRMGGLHRRPPPRGEGDIKGGETRRCVLQ